MRRLILLSSILASIGGCTPAAEIDPAVFQQKIDDTWKEVGRLLFDGAKQEADALQQAVAEDCWGYYLTHSRSDTGNNALACAFKMWRNLGDHGRIGEMLPRVDPNAAVWYRILPFVRGVYRNAHLDEEYHRLFERLERELTHPLARSELLQSLAEDAMLAGELDRAAAYHREIVTLDADPVYVDRARNALQESSTLAIGSPAPAFSAPDIDGNAISLASLEGKVVLLEFWASYCAPCMPAIDQLVRLRAEYPATELAIVGISFDQSSQAVRRFLSRRELAWPQLCDGKGSEGDVARLYNVEQLPRSFVIDRGGKIAAKDQRGATLEETLRRLIGAKETPD